MSLLLPQSKVKSIIKSDPDVKKISGAAVSVLTELSTTFIQLLARESYKYCEKSKRKTLQYQDVSAAVHDIDQLDFLQQIIPKVQIAP
ncbi:hypothetical protein RCL1_000675 [Eukaryota sp. TZLM3-RCL]